MIRFGLCCLFKKEPIRFRRTTAAFQSKFGLDDQRRRLAEICLHNAHTLYKALSYCRAAEIGAFRINSQILPLFTHPQRGYSVWDLPGGDDIVGAFRQCGEFAHRYNIRTSFHPDQFVVIASPRSDVRKKSLQELGYQAMIADWVGADVINLHAGGAYGDKTASLKRLVSVVTSLPAEIRSRLTLENDDRVFSPADLLPVCREAGVPMVYDVHHHRCLPDQLSIGKATLASLNTWNREPLFHISSPLERERLPTDRRHADTIDVRDFPDAWRSLDLTVDVEAKAKEVAVKKLRSELDKQPCVTENHSLIGSG